MTVISDVLHYCKLEAGKMKFECILYEPKSVLEGSFAAIHGTCEEKKLELLLKEWHTDIPFCILGDGGSKTQKRILDHYGTVRVLMF